MSGVIFRQLNRIHGGAVSKHQRSPRQFWLAAACCGMLRHAAACCGMLRHASSCWSRVPPVILRLFEYPQDLTCQNNTKKAKICATIERN